MTTLKTTTNQLKVIQMVEIRKQIEWQKQQELFKKNKKPLYI